MFLRLDTDESGRLKPGSPVAQEPLFSDYRIDLPDPEACCRPWPRTPCCRRALHIAFFRWYRANEDRFAIKLEMREHADASLAIGFPGVNPIVTAWLADHGITVPVLCQGTHWDTILDLDTLPKRVPGGYVCDLCPEEDRPVFPSRDDLWRDHLFQPFLQWVNDDLAKAAEISITGTPDWASWARLVSVESE